MPSLDGMKIEDENPCIRWRLTQRDLLLPLFTTLWNRMEERYETERQERYEDEGRNDTKTKGRNEWKRRNDTEGQDDLAATGAGSLAFMHSNMIQTVSEFDTTTHHSIPISLSKLLICFRAHRQPKQLILTNFRRIHSLLSQSMFSILRRTRDLKLLDHSQE